MLTDDVRAIIGDIEALHPEDPRIQDHWSRLTEALARDEAATLHLLDELRDPGAVNHISAVFHDVAERLQSPAFIHRIEALAARFPELTLEHMVEWAREAIAEP